MTVKLAKRLVNGVLLLDKPEGLSSNTTLQKARRLYNTEKAGHTGVLDPLATRLLPICFGEATKFARYLLDADKACTTTLKLGEASSTEDAKGETIATVRADISLAEFQTACQALTSNIRQVPPMFSAFKHEGKPLYEYARKGIVIKRKPRDITVYAIDITGFDAPKAVISVRCSKDTYIRTLSKGIAKYIGALAHPTALRHAGTAGFTIRKSYTLKTLAVLDETERNALLLSCDVLVRHLPKIELNDRAVTMLKCGQHPQFTEDISADQPTRVYDHGGAFIGLAEYQKEIGHLKALRLMNTDNDKRL